MCITDIGQKRVFGKYISFLKHPLKKFLFTGSCIFIEPVYKQGKSGSITNWKKTKNSWKGLQKTDERKQVS